MRRSTIQNKITRAILITSTVVLLLTGIAYITYEFITFRDATVERVSVLADVISNNSTAALAFNSQEDAYEILSALRVEENVVTVALYDEDENLFSSYPKNLDSSEFPKSIREEGYYFEDTYLHDFQPVILGNRQIGTLYIKYDLRPLSRQYFYFGLVALLIFVLSLLLAYFLSSRLRRNISRPIIALAAVAHNISFYKDYSVRAKKQTDDEIGLLTDAFNQMLKQIEQQSFAIKESEKRFRALADNIAQLAWMTDEKGTIIWFNKRWYDYTGTNENDLGKGWKRFQHQKHSDRVYKKFNNALSKGKIWEDTFPLRGKDGEYRWFLSRAVPIKDDNGVITQWFGTNTDISEIMKVEEALRQSEEFSRTLLESTPDCVIALNMDGQILSINPQGQKMLEIDNPDQFINKDWASLWKEEYHQEVARSMAKAKIGEFGHFQAFSPTQKNNEKWWDVMIAPVYGSDRNVERLVSVARDITKIKELEQQKDDFLSIASHELKTPVTSIKAYTQVLYSMFEEDQQSEAAKMLLKMDGQLEKLTVLIADLLDVTRIEQGKLLFRKEEFDLNELVREKVEEIQRTTQKHMIELDLNKIKPISADPDRIGQVIINFLSNAIKYSAKSKEIIVRTSMEKDEVILAVQDFGVGLSEEDRKKVFERFYRVVRSGYETFPGLGLGLYISAEIISRHNGRIWADSEKGKGTTFYFSLPV